MKDIVFSIYLLWAAVYDLRTRKIPVVLCLFFGLMGGILCIKENQPGDIVPAVLPGVLSLLLTCLTCGAMGAGDGVFLLTAAVYLSKAEVWILWMGGLLCCSLGGIIFLIRKTGRKESVSEVWKQRLPFLPFLVPVWLLMHL